MLFNRADQDQRYTFNESGTYVVKLTTSNEFCSSTDSVTVKITTSDIQVPPVFTPDNGDELNDEFRVAYKSILSFKCWIFNRWGRQLYFWTDPQKGWDGKINFHRGACSIGLRGARVITPVVVRMQPGNFKKGQPWYHIPRHTIHYTFTVGADIDPQTWLAQKPLPIAARQLNDYLHH